MTRFADDLGRPTHENGSSEFPGNRVVYIKVGDMRRPSDSDTCLRPLGLCELGGSCDSCWYRPDHPRFKE